MRDISDLIKKEKPVKQMTDDEMMARLVAEDARRMREFGRPDESQGPSWGIRKKWN